MLTCMLEGSYTCIYAHCGSTRMISVHTYVCPQAALGLQEAQEAVLVNLTQWIPICSNDLFCKSSKHTRPKDGLADSYQNVPGWLQRYVLLWAADG